MDDSLPLIGSDFPVGIIDVKTIVVRGGRRHTEANDVNTVAILFPHSLLLVVAAAFSLLVAGIGIMNIMLVSVTERTKEIGLRMSVGARGIDISSQFLVESIIISLTGGVLGIVVGYLGTLICGNFGLPTSIPMWSIFVSFAVCTIIGVGFGYFPAQKAANMDPIEAIRYE